MLNKYNMYVNFIFYSHSLAENGTLVKVKNPQVRRLKALLL